jgi:hypothetical protein
MTTDGPRIRIYDPPMCCPTGLCGPTVDPVLLDINEAVVALKSDGVTGRAVRAQLAAPGVPS